MTSDVRGPAHEPAADGSPSDAGQDRRPLVATYRLQLHAGFTFRDAVDVLDHLAALGVSHIHTSPVLDAVPGSDHGYDVVDHHRPNDELGGEEGFRQLVVSAHERGMGLVVDVVVNHMGTHPHNTRWWDVLRFGRSSAFESWFDIDWDHGSEEMSDRLLLAVLRDHYGQAVRQGDVRLDIDHDDALVVRLQDAVFPMSILSIGIVLQEAAKDEGDEAFLAEVDELARCGDSVADHSDALRRLSHLRRFWQGDRRVGVQRVLDAINDDPHRLHRLLELQHYRLAHWSTGPESVDYRRFVDVSELIGLQMQVPAVFESVHSRTLQWIGAGDVDGVRADFVDGLVDPTKYVQELRSHAPDTWIVVDKVLTRGEALPEEWPIDGTTGHESLALLDRLFVDPEGEQPLRSLFRQHTEVTDEWATVSQQAKADVLHQVIPAEVHRLTNDLSQYDRVLLDRVDRSDYDARAVISAFLVEFPVYRTYARDGEPMGARDSAVIESVRAAVHARGVFDPALVDLVAALLMGPLDNDIAIRFRSRFQQTTAPVMSKGIVDTASYRFPRLVSMNDVGGDPDVFGIDVEAFHTVQARAAESEPRRMITTSTHDTRRSEDVRSRISVLSEVPEQWERALDAMTERAKALGGDDRDPVVEYLLHQTIVGAHPISPERVIKYARKAAREAKRATSWLDPVGAHEQALVDHVSSWLVDETYLAAVGEIVDVIFHAGRINGLALKLLALTIPGIPDLYQGSELWTGDVVAPDNRRTVDYARRRELLARDHGTSPLDLDDDGTAKIRVIRAALGLRHRHLGAFAPGSGTYRPLVAEGPAREHVIGFVRGEEVAVVVPRLLLRLERNGGWGTTHLTLPAGRWRDALSDQSFEGSVEVADLLTINPVALLERM